MPGAAGAPRVAPIARAAGFEAWAFGRACTLLPSPAVWPGGAEEVASLERCFTLYRAGMDEAGACGGRLHPVSRSRETLACWALACLADRAACALHPQLGRYHAALRFSDLRWLSLTDGLAHAALQAVCAYLRRRTADGALGRPVFSGRPEDATPLLAAEVGRDSAEISEM